MNFTNEPTASAPEMLAMSIPSIIRTDSPILVCHAVRTALLSARLQITQAGRSFGRTPAVESFYQPDWARRNMAAFSYSSDCDASAICFLMLVLKSFGTLRAKKSRQAHICFFNIRSCRLFLQRGRVHCLMLLQQTRPENLLFGRLH